MNEAGVPDYKAAIAASGKDIYQPVEIGDADCWIPTQRLEEMLNSALRGKSLAGLPLRTRSKIVKSAVCAALGYPVPASFKRAQPRFPGQQLDVYVQKALNLQVWNQQLAPAQRYALIRVDAADVIVKVRVVDGMQLAAYDNTGTLTTKYQARLTLGHGACELVSSGDTQALLPHLGRSLPQRFTGSPVGDPESGKLLPIQDVFARLATLVGQRFANPGADQERNRGAGLHQLVCRSLGYQAYEDRGQFPDIRHQLVEVKLQTSPTIDLGRCDPASKAYLDLHKPGALRPRHCDVRYALFFAQADATQIELTHLLLTTGADFFSRFKRFEGNVTNRKIQIPLPGDFFDR